MVLTSFISLTHSVISVPRVDDQEESVIHPSSLVPSKPQSPPVPPLPTVVQKSESSSSSSSSSSESSCSSSVTVTETETAARHISEGELLLNHGQMAAVRGRPSSNTHSHHQTHRPHKHLLSNNKIGIYKWLV